MSSAVLLLARVRSSIQDLGPWRRILHDSGAVERSAIVENSYEIGEHLQQGKGKLLPLLKESRSSCHAQRPTLDVAFVRSSLANGHGNTNLGLKDQRMAFDWIQEMSVPWRQSRGSIWGESEELWKSYSVGYHLTAYGGRDDGLLRDPGDQHYRTVLFLLDRYSTCSGTPLNPLLTLQTENPDSTSYSR